MDATILYLFKEFASKMKEADDTKELEQMTYQNLQNILNFHRGLLHQTTKDLYPVEIVVETGKEITFTKLCADV